MAPTILCDNLSIVLLATNLVLHNRAKHFELDFYYARDQVVSKQVYVSHIPSEAQIVDILTKSLSQSKFLEFCTKLRVFYPSSLSFAGGCDK